MKKYVLDTNIFIKADRDQQWAVELEQFSWDYLPYLHLSAIVAQEMLAGALNRDRERAIRANLISPFERRGRLITPSYSAWTRAGHVMAELVSRKLMSPGGFGRSFVNDCLLATSCRERGATLITLNTKDFELIQNVESLDVMPPWPS
jgi:predicted nucleic acid-binding protein